MFGKLKSPKDFTMDTTRQLHDYASKKGFAPKGMVMIPELMMKGQEFVLGWLRNENFQSQFVPDRVTEYYYNLMAFCLCGGMAYAAQWEADYSKIQNGEFDEELYSDGILETALPLARNTLKLSDGEFLDMVEELFEKWCEIHKPYWELKDCREYTFNLYMAYFQLGVSLYLGQKGY